MKKNLLSVAIPIFNGAEHISKTLNALLKQKNFDLIISDNNSNDGTKKILKEFSKRYKNIRVNYNRKNIGFDNNLMKCVELCKTKYVWLITDDDLVKKGSINIINNIIKNKKKEYGLIFIDNVFKFSQIKTDKFGSDPNKFFKFTKFRSGGMSSNIINRKIWKKINLKKYPKDWPHLVYAIIALSFSDFYIYRSSLKSEIDMYKPKRWLHNSSLFNYLLTLKKTYDIFSDYNIYNNSTITESKKIISSHISTAIIIDKIKQSTIDLKKIRFIISNSRMHLLKNLFLLSIPSKLYAFYKKISK